MKRLGSADPTDRIRRIVIVAGRKSHGPDGNGIHDYPAMARLLHDGLMRGTLGTRLEVVRAEDDAWPAQVIAEADVLVVIGDGRDGDLPSAQASHLANPERIALVESAVARGMGVVAIHFSTFTPELMLPRVLNWQGAAFQWEKDGKRDWQSRITWATGMPDLLAPRHPVLNGVVMGRLREEYYHRMVFHHDATPLIALRSLPGADQKEQTVAWACSRPEGGRGFGTTMAHSLDSLRHDGLRTVLLNGIAWSAGANLPTAGIGVSFSEREDVDYRLGLGMKRAAIRVAVLAGNAAHRWHHWPETTAAFLQAWSDDPRITTRVHTDAADLATCLIDRDVLVLNWVNWSDPLGMPETSRMALQDFIARGGGVFIHHFANGACHASLPGAGASDWPWYRTLVRRVWQHHDIIPGPSGHDRFRSFMVSPCSDHPLVAGMAPFTVADELYWRQHGDEPITVLMTAHSEETGVDEPMAWSYDIDSARVVQSLLGHSTKTYDAGEMRAFLRRAVAWCAHRAIHGPANEP